MIFTNLPKENVLFKDVFVYPENFVILVLHELSKYYMKLSYPKIEDENIIRIFYKNLI